MLLRHYFSHMIITRARHRRAADAAQRAICCCLRRFDDYYAMLIFYAIDAVAAITRATYATLSVAIDVITFITMPYAASAMPLRCFFFISCHAAALILWADIAILLLMMSFSLLFHVLRSFVDSHIFHAEVAGYVLRYYAMPLLLPYYYKMSLAADTLRHAIIFHCYNRWLRHMLLFPQAITYWCCWYAIIIILLPW